MAKPDERELKLLRELADFLEVEELTSEALATSLGFDELTPERLEEWFITEVLCVENVDAPEPATRVVQVKRDHGSPTGPIRAALPPARPKRTGSSGPG
jgi:hypothetical protein